MNTRNKAMGKVSIQTLVTEIAPFNNAYREDSAPINDKLRAMWRIGDALLRLGVKAPHSVGWQVQKATNGLIKRPTVFRSFKLRAIWANENDLLNDIGGISGLSNLTEMFPLIDPAQNVREKLDKETLRSIYEHARRDSPGGFRKYAKSVKATYAHGRLGQSLDKSKHLHQFDHLARAFMSLRSSLSEILMDEQDARREELRRAIPRLEAMAFSNMCIALTTKDNYRLFKKMGPDKASSSLKGFAQIYDEFRSLLAKQVDEERARLRRILSAQDLALMSDMVSSVLDESSVANFRERRKLTMRLQ